MRTLADDLLAVLPALMSRHSSGPMVKDMAAYLAASPMSVTEAARYLDIAQLAIFLRYPGSKARHLVPPDFAPGPDLRICANCRIVFERPKTSKRVCCGRSCANGLSWKDTEAAEDRKIAIRASKATPEARAAQAELNRRRWSDPEQHERLSEQNRRRWADPATKAQRAASIQAVNGSPEKRAKASATRKALWADPEYRERATAAIKAAKNTPEARALFSELLKARWRDPVLRQKYLAATRRNAAVAAEKVRGVKQSAEHIGRRFKRKAEAIDA